MVDRAALVFLSLRAVLALFVVAATAGCTDLFFHPSRTLTGSPADLGLAYRDVWFEAADGTPLHGWFLPARGDPKGLLLHLHGNAGNVACQSARKRDPQSASKRDPSPNVVGGLSR